jgi:DNA invertase Pin-like site-specific DNA recombinase
MDFVPCKRSYACEQADRSDNVADGKFVAYYRVSTDRQGRSGLGLEAQQKTVTDYLNGGAWELVDAFIEVESGKSHKNRPQLTAALAACKKHKATLVIANLSRLSRNAGFLLTLRDSGVDVRACDMPTAGTLEFGFRAVLAQHTREEISKTTKAALAAAKARGVQLGTNGKLLARKYRSEALGRASGLADTVRALQATHPTVRALTEALNARGVSTPKGGQWHASSVHRLLRRIEETQSSSAA